MASEDKNYSLDFKTKVAKEALNLSSSELEKLSDDYDIPVSRIKVWKTELAKAIDDLDNVFGTLPEEEIAELSKEHEDVEIEVSNTGVANSLEKGVMSDKLNYKRITFWSILGVIIFILFVQTLVMVNKKNVADYEGQANKKEQYLADQLRRQANKKINNFGVVDLEKKIYRIPIDSAMKNVVKEEQQD